MRTHSPKSNFGGVVLRKNHWPACHINPYHDGATIPMIPLYISVSVCISTHFSIGSSKSQVLSAVVIATKSIDEALREKTKTCPDGSLRMILPLDVDICQTNQPCNLLLWSFVLAKTDGCGKRGVRRMPYAPS